MNINIRTVWTHDNEVLDIPEDLDNPDEWQAWSAEVIATTVTDSGELVAGSSFLGGVWAKVGDRLDPDISGYRAQMEEEAIADLHAKLSDMKRL
jgi:hypothetical protein